MVNQINADSGIRRRSQTLRDLVLPDASQQCRATNRPNAGRSRRDVPRGRRRRRGRPHHRACGTDRAERDGRRPGHDQRDARCSPIGAAGNSCTERRFRRASQSGGVAAPDQKTAIVTGASRGIGAAIAERLARYGFTVVINYAGSAAPAEASTQGRNGGGEVTASAS
jgi:hypothetical protein